MRKPSCPWCVNLSVICTWKETTQLSMYLQLPILLYYGVFLIWRRRENIFLDFFFSFVFKKPSKHLSSLFHFCSFIACSRCSSKGSCLSLKYNLSLLLFQAYIEKYKFTSVVAQDLLDSFLNFFPELKEQCVENKAGRKFTWLTVNRHCRKSAW